MPPTPCAHPDKPWRETVSPELWPVYEDFRNFLALVWDFLGLPTPTAIQFDIAYFMQHGPRRKVCKAFRGAGKSWIADSYAAWQLLRDAQMNIMVTSATKPKADNFSTFILQLLNGMPLLQHLTPKTGQRESRQSFDVAGADADPSPSVKSTGIFGQISGDRADLILADDIEIPNNSETQGKRDKLAERVTEFDAVLKPGGSVCFLGTPQVEDSLYSVLADRGYTIRIWPARFPDAKWMKRNGAMLAPLLAEKLEANPGLAGKPTEPTRFPEPELMERELSFGKAGFALQFMLDTSLADLDRYPLRLVDLITMDVHTEKAPEEIIWASTGIHEDLPNLGLHGDRYTKPMAVLGNWIPYKGRMMYIDPSGRGKDETAYVVTGHLNGYIHLLDVDGYRDGYSPETLTRLAEVAKQYGVNCIQIEDNFGDGMFLELFKPVLAKVGHRCELEGLKVRGQKELRIIDTLEPVMAQHRLVVNRAAVENDYGSAQKYHDVEDHRRYSLFYQMTRITRDRGSLLHDDRLDALSGAVRYWAEQMALDVSQQRDAEAERQLEEEIRLHEENAFGVHKSLHHNTLFSRR